MPFDAFDVSLDMIRSLREPLAAVAERDPALAQQLRRAAASVPLNLSEGRRRNGLGGPGGHGATLWHMRYETPYL